MWANAGLLSKYSRILEKIFVRRLLTKIKMLHTERETRCSKFNIIYITTVLSNLE